jgi:putative MATE family efflux protein
LRKTAVQKLTLFALTWPIFIEILLHMLMGNADTLMLSQYSDHSVAAVGVSNQLLNMLIVMFGFIATGTSVLIAQYIGAKQEKRAREVVVVSLTANIIYSFALCAVLFLFAETFLSWLNVPEELMAEAVVYTRWVGGFSFLTALIMTVGVALKSYGFTRDAMYVTIGMNVLNVCGNYVFIFGPFGIPVLGVDGVALATIVSRFVGLALITVLLFKRIKDQMPFLSVFRLPREHLRNLLKIGIPSAGEHLAYNLSQLIIIYFITLLGTEMLTTRVYAFNIMMFILVFAISISQGTQILIGYKIGEGRNNEAYALCMRSLRLAMMISFALAALASLFSDQLFSIFTDNRAIISAGGSLIMLCMLLEPGRCFNLVIINALRAAGDVRFPVYMGIISMLGVSVPLAYFLGIHLGYGLFGVWIAYIVDEWLRGLLMLWRWRSRTWERMSFVRPKRHLAS